MTRVVPFILMLSLLAGCTPRTAGPATTGTTGTPLASTTPGVRPSTTAGAGATTSSLPPPSDPRELVGRVITAHWEDDGLHQQYYAGGLPTGYFGGPRFPLARRGDDITHFLGFAETSGVGDERGPYDQRFVGTVLLLEPAGVAPYDEPFLVLDVAPVELPAGAGVMAAVCPDETGVPRYAAMLEFTPGGLTAIHWWRPDLNDNLLTRPTGTPPDCTILEDPVQGTVVSVVGAWHAVTESDRGRFLNINTMPLQRLDWWEFAGGGTVSPYVTVLMVRNHHEPASADQRQAWLVEQMGWDYGGYPIWLIRETLDLRPAGSDYEVSASCESSSGTGAVAIIADPCSDPVPAAAWLVEAEGPAFTATDPSTVTCSCELGD